MMRAQGALEYLIIIAAVLGISAVVVLFVSGAFTSSTAGADIAKCRLAAANCQRDLTLGLGTSCIQCEAACKDSAGKDLLSGIVEPCGLACTQCKQGLTIGGSIGTGGGTGISLAGYWAFDETTGATANDGSGNGNTATFSGETFANGLWSGTPAWTTRSGNNAASFSGSNYIVTSYNGEFLQDMTVTAWFKLSDWGSRAVVGRWFSMGPTKDQGWMLYRNQGESTGQIAWLFYFNQTNGLVSNVRPLLTSIALDTWYYTAAVIRADGTYSTYLNGQLVTAGTTPGLFKSWGGNESLNSIKLAIGRSSDIYGWNYYGAIDSVRLWNRALSQAEIQSDMNSLYPVSKANYSWSLDEGSGTTTSETHERIVGKKGGALSFDGIDDYVSASDSSSLKFSNLTISAWIKWDGTRYAAATLRDYAAIVSKGTFGGGEFSTLLTRATGLTVTNINFYINGNLRTVWSNSLIDTGWHNLVITYNETTPIFYFDGVEKWRAQLAAVSIPDTANPLTIGRESSGTYTWGGALDEVRVYNRILSPVEVSALYANP